MRNAKPTQSGCWRFLHFRGGTSIHARRLLRRDRGARNASDLPGTLKAAEGMKIYKYFVDVVYRIPVLSVHPPGGLFGRYLQQKPRKHPRSPLASRRSSIEKCTMMVSNAGESAQYDAGHRDDRMVQAKLPKLEKGREIQFSDNRILVHPINMSK